MDAVDGMLCDAAKELSEVELWVQAVEFRCTDERVDGCRTNATRISAGKEVIAATKRDGAERPLGAAVVDFYLPVIGIAGKSTPVGERITNRCRSVGLVRKCRE